MIRNLVASSILVGMLTVGAYAAPTGYPMFINGYLYPDDSLVFVNKFTPGNPTTITVVLPDCEDQDNLNFGVFIAPLDDLSTEEDEGEPIAASLEKGCVQEVSFDVEEEGFYNVVVSSFSEERYIYFLESDGND